MIRQNVYIAYDKDDSDTYQAIKEWENNDQFEYTFCDAGCLPGAIEGNAQNALADVLKKSCAFLLLVGEQTNQLKGTLLDEINAALLHNIPIICVNINGAERKDVFCPDLMDQKLCLFVPYDPDLLYKAMIYWPHDHQELANQGKKTAYYY